MPSEYKLARYAELEELLRSEGVDVKAVAAKWGVLPDRVIEYMAELKARGVKFERRRPEKRKWRYFLSTE